MIHVCWNGQQPHFIEWMWINGCYVTHSRQQHLSPMLKENLCSTAVLPWILRSEGTGQSSHLRGTDPARDLQLHTGHHAHADFLHTSPATSAGSTPWPAQTLAGTVRDDKRWSTTVFWDVMPCCLVVHIYKYLHSQCCDNLKFHINRANFMSLFFTSFNHKSHLYNYSQVLKLCTIAQYFRIISCPPYFGFIYILHTNKYNTCFP